MTTLWVGCFGDVASLQELRVSDHRIGERVQDLSLDHPTWLVDAPFGLWAIDHAQQSAVVPVDLSTSIARPGSPTPTHGQDACHAALNPSGRALAVAQYSSGSLAVVPVDGSEASDALLLAFEGHSGVVPDRQEAPHAHQVTWLDDHHLLVCDLGADCVRVVRLDGVLTEVGRIDTARGSGPRHLVLRQREGTTEFAVAGELDGRVTAFRHDGGDWASGWSETASCEGSLVGGNQPSALRLLNDGLLVLANRGINTISLVEWGDADLAIADEFDCGGDHPRDLVVHDERLWVANKESGSICVLEHTETSGGSWVITQRFEITQPAALLFR